MRTSRSVRSISPCRVLRAVGEEENLVVPEAVSLLHRLGAVPRRAPQHPGDPQQELLQVERFDQVVVGPLGQPGYPVACHRSGRQHQHRDPGVELPIFRQTSKPLIPGKHDVKDDQLEPLDLHLLERSSPLSTWLTRYPSCSRLKVIPRARCISSSTRSMCGFSPDICYPFCWCPVGSGSVMRKVQPLPGPGLSTEILPPWAFTTDLTM